MKVTVVGLSEKDPNKLLVHLDVGQDKDGDTITTIDLKPRTITNIKNLNKVRIEYGYSK